MSNTEATQEKSLLAPRYWGVWLAFGLLRLMSLLPFNWQMRLGRTLGRISYRLNRSRRRIASRNLRLCFPDKNEDALQALVKSHFENLGITIFEMAMAYYRPKRLHGRYTWHGIEHLDALTPGSVILLTAHFGPLEVGGTALKQHGVIFDAVYRQDNNALMNQLIRRGREQAGRTAIEKSDIKMMVRSLRDDVPVWYAPDQSYRRKQSGLLPFFGVPAMTNTATSALARLGRAHVVGFFPHRKADLSGYDIYVHPPLDDFPGENAEVDTARITSLFEAEILRSPAQYYWVHRKFKGRPAHLPDVYADLSDEDN
ncbi:MAG: LpxL/LpxP family Kdo(2)-lipid IV(A) lauroyl/palmitoleoyl acyltransferase [Woeseiaceae bacterium]